MHHLGRSVLLLYCDIHVETLEIFQSILFCWKWIYVAFLFPFFCKNNGKRPAIYTFFFYEKSLYIKSKRYNCDGSLKNRKIQNNWRKNDSRNVIGLERNKKYMQICKCMQYEIERRRTIDRAVIKWFVALLPIYKSLIGFDQKVCSNNSQWVVYRVQQKSWSFSFYLIPFLE